MRKTNYLQIATSSLHRTAGPYKIYGAEERATVAGLADISATARTLGLFGEHNAAAARRRSEQLELTRQACRMREGRATARLAAAGFHGDHRLAGRACLVGGRQQSGAVADPFEVKHNGAGRLVANQVRKDPVWVTSAWLPTDTRMLKPTPTSYPRLNIVAISAPLWLTTPIGPTGDRSTPIANEAVSASRTRVLTSPRRLGRECASAGARDLDDAPLARRAFGANLRHLRRNDHRGAHAGCHAVLQAGKS